ncbi:hypothetical protein Tco_1486474 [Tanacetum coccineum]
MRAMANTIPIVTTVTKTAPKEKKQKETDAAPKGNILDFWDNTKRSRRIREGSQNLSAGTLFVRYRNPSERPKVRDRLKDNDGNVFGWLGHRRQSIFDRLSDTYLPSTTKSRPDWASSRDHSHSRGCPHRRDSSLSRDHPRSRDRSRGIALVSRKEEGKVNPYYLAYRRATPTMEDTGSQSQKGTSLRMKMT